MKQAFTSAALAAALFGAAPLALAEAPPVKPAPSAERAKAPSNPEPLRPVLGEAAPAKLPRVQAFHRVDVIAPGERVETILDRNRVQRPAMLEEDARPLLPPRSMERREPQSPGQGGGTGRIPPVVLPSSGGGFPPIVQPVAPGSFPARGPDRDRGHR